MKPDLCRHTILGERPIRGVALAPVGHSDDVVAFAGRKPHQAVVVVRLAVVAAHRVHFAGTG
jgi:hypothetical protein